MDNSFLEFELIGYKTIILREGKGSVRGLEVLRKEFDKWEDGEIFFNKLIQEKTTSGFYTEDSLKKLKSALQSIDGAEAFMSFDLSGISFEEYENELPTDTINISIGRIESPQRWLPRYMTWLTILRAFQDGISKALDTKEFKAFSHRKPNWLVTAQEHGQLNSILCRVENGQLVKAPSGETFWCEKGGDLYHSMSLFLLNGQLRYPGVILTEAFKAAVKVPYNEPDFSELVEDVCTSFIDYFKSENEFDLIHFEWYESGDPTERYASAYAYQEQKS